MDPETYDKRAESARKKGAAESGKAANLELRAAKEDELVHKDMSAASSASSPSTMRTKQRSADSHARRAMDYRKQAATAKKNAAKAETDVAKAVADASKERSRLEKARLTKQRQEDSKQKRDADRARREGEADARLRAARDRKVDTNLATVGAQTGTLAARMAQMEAELAASKQDAPLKATVLFIAGTPLGGLAPLRLDREAREIAQRIQSGKHRDQIKFRTLQATRVGDLTDALNEQAPDIVHFSGHGALSRPLEI